MKTLITGACKFNKEQINNLTKIGLDISFLQNEKDDIDFREFEFVICNGLFLYHDISLFENLKYIQLISAGLDRVPLDYINNHNIKLFNARGVYSIPMAEWTILKILEIYKKSQYFYSKQKLKHWKKNRNILELNGKEATIIGYGSVGREIAKRLKAFNVTINIVDIIDNKDEYVDKFYFIYELEQVIQNTDIVILTLPLTEETEGIINKEKLNHIKEGSVLINIARGKIINEKDLIDIIKTNKLRGVALDVFEEEPLNTVSELWSLENVIITPHNSFIGENNSSRLFELIKNNIVNLER